MPLNKNAEDYSNNVILTNHYSDKEHCTGTEHSRSLREHVNKYLTNKNEQTKYFSEPNVFDKSIHISKLRSILTEAISNVTKENQLKKGESVELTLEIELLKTEHNTPTNSLLEVTVLEHNKSDKRKYIQDSQNKITFKSETKQSSSESVSLKQRSWLRKTINNSNQENIDLYEKYNKHKIPKNENITHDFIENERKFLYVRKKYMKKDCKNRKNFVTVLPDEILKNNSNIFPKRPKSRYNTTITTTDYPLVKKLSNLFLPIRKQEQFTVANTNKGMKVIKDRTNNINHKLEKNTIDDDLEQFKHYFEHTTNTNNIHTEMTKNKKNVEKISKSYSDTCIKYHSGTLNSGPINYNDADDLSVINQSIEQTKNAKNNMEYQSQKFREKMKSKNNVQQSHTTNGRGDTIDHYKQPKIKELSKPHKKKTTIYWNGKNIEINNQIKKQIEKLVLNELQNVALKDGMECEVTPLPSTDESLFYMKKVDKVSSYMCELDIRDVKMRKSLKKRKLLDKKYKKKRERHNNFITESNNRDEPSSDGLDNANKELFRLNAFDVNCCEMYNQERPLLKNYKVQDNKQCAENKYLKCSSGEYCNVISKSLVESEMNARLENNVIVQRQIDSNEVLAAEGFVKKIASNDSTWRDFLSGKHPSEEKSQDYKLDTYSNKVEYSSVTSKECENKVEIALTTQDLEFLLKEAKEKHNASKIYIYKKCNNCNNGKHRKSKRPTVETSKSYTELLLSKASKKLKKYTK